VLAAFPGAPEGVVAEPETEAGLVWLEAERPAGGVAAGSGDEPGADALAGAELASRPVRRARATAPQDEVASLGASTAAAPSATTESVGDSLAMTGASSASGAAEATGTATGAGSGAGARGSVDGSGSGPGLGTDAGEAVQPRLLAWSNPCAGYFPTGAHVAHGSVQVSVEVGASGQITTTQVMAEHPRDEGFGRAARACIEQLRFSPARTSEGRPVAGRARLLLRFDRS